MPQRGAWRAPGGLQGMKAGFREASKHSKSEDEEEGNRRGGGTGGATRRGGRAGCPFGVCVCSPSGGLSAAPCTLDTFTLERCGSNAGQTRA